MADTIDGLTYVEVAVSGMECDGGMWRKEVAVHVTFRLLIRG
jgi:formylmethanofuran dehydrogenase subunit B